MMDMRHRHVSWLAMACLLALLALRPMTAAEGMISPKTYSLMALIGLRQEPGTYHYLDNVFAPLGWSQDGKFAYITTVTNEARGPGEMAVLRWVIQDMVSDKILWDSGDKFEGLPKSMWDEAPLQIIQWEWTHLQSYRTQMEKYKIRLSPGMMLGKFPLMLDGHDYRALIANHKRGERFGFPDMLLQFDLLLTKGDVAKAAAQFRGVFLLDAHVGGFVRSPYEPRLAVVLCTVRRGWEGPPHPVECRVSGSHLERGFDAGNQEK